MAEQYFTYMSGSQPKPGARNNYTYNGDVTSFDLENWSLSSKTCELANLQVRATHEKL